MANIVYYVYEKISGAGISIESRPKGDCIINLDEGQDKTLAKFDFDTQLFDGVKVNDKPFSKIILTGTKFENLPKPTTVTITGNGAIFRETIEDGEFEFSVDVPGKYTAKCESRVELPIEFEVVIK